METNEEKDRRVAENHDRRAATHEPPPTMDGPVILETAVRIVEGRAKQEQSRGNPTTHDDLMLVSRALTLRAEMGKAKYGTYLRANNGRNALVDLYQELLDALMYSQQCMEELNIFIAKDYLEAPPINLLLGAGCFDGLLSMTARVAGQIAKADA